MPFLPPRKKTFPTVNLIPFVDCLMVVVAYLLLNLSFSKLATLSSTAGRPSTEQGPANVEGYLTVSLQANGVLTFGGHTENEVFSAIPPVRKGELDTNAFARFLGQLPRSYRNVVIIPTPSTTYRDIAKLTELSQRDLRAVILSPAVGKGI